MLEQWVYGVALAAVLMFLAAGFVLIVGDLVKGWKKND